MEHGRVKDSSSRVGDDRGESPLNILLLLSFYIMTFYYRTGHYCHPHYTDASPPQCKYWICPDVYRIVMAELRLYNIIIVIKSCFRYYYHVKNNIECSDYDHYGFDFSSVSVICFYHIIQQHDGHDSRETMSLYYY